MAEFKLKKNEAANTNTLTQFERSFNSYEDLIICLRTEENARRYIAFLRWGGHPKCPHCNHQGECTYLDKRKVFYCGSCAKQFSSTKDTLFDRTHIPLLTWFRAIFEIANGSISSVRLAKKLNVKQNTAWKMEQKIRQSLKEDLDGVTLSNIVEADTSVITPDLGRDFQRKFQISKISKIIEKDNNPNTRNDAKNWRRNYVKRKLEGLPPLKVGRKAGGKNANKSEQKKNKYYKYEKWLLGMVERGGKIYIQTICQHSTDINAKEIATIMNERIAEGTRVITDGGSEFNSVKVFFPNHGRIIHDPWVEYTKKDGTKGNRRVKKFVEGDNHTNSIESTWAHLKRVQWGNHIQITYGHANKYLYEFAFQRNNRKLSDAEKFQLILRSALKLSCTYGEFKHYTRVYKINEEGNKVGERILLKNVA